MSPAYMLHGRTSLLSNNFDHCLVIFHDDKLSKTFELGIEGATIKNFKTCLAWNRKRVQFQRFARACFRDKLKLPSSCQGRTKQQPSNDQANSKQAPSKYQASTWRTPSMYQATTKRVASKHQASTKRLPGSE